MRALCALLVFCIASRAGAETMVPGPADPGFDPDLERKAHGIGRLLHALITVPLGWGLEAFVADPAAREAVDAFAASSGGDFRAVTGRHPYEVVSYYEEFGDLGMFGGVQAAGDAFRYAVLLRGGAPGAELEEARARVLRALDGLHWYTAVTGVPGVVARGLRRITPEPGEPPLPGEIPEVVPLRDASGQPLPADKTMTWRADGSGEAPFLIWLDDTSKDQLDGYVFALGVYFDLLADDRTIPRGKIERLVEDARAIGLALIERVEVQPGVFIDLTIRDADGRLTTFHDLSAEELSPGVVFDTPVNGFNAWMALGIVRTLYHITDDERLGRFYYDDLIGRRGYLAASEEVLPLMYVGPETNFSNVNMAFVAAYGVLRYESDDDVAVQARLVLEQLYAPGVDRDADELGQSFFDFVYAAFRIGGSSGAGADAREDGLVSLREHPAAPLWNHPVENCDAGEIETLDCVGTDGTPLPLLRSPGRGGGLVARDPVPMRLRPPSNFMWRSDPHSVNGGGGDRLNPGGDFHAAYWMGRYLAAGVDGLENRAARLRPRPAPGAQPPDAGAPPDGLRPTSPDAGPAAGGAPGGGGCAAAPLGARR